MAMRAKRGLPPASVVRYVEEVHGVPVLRVDAEKQEVLLGFRGAITRLDQELGTAQEVGQALADLEAYVDTVDFGQSLDPRCAKTSMYEAALYAMASLFAHEQMKGAGAGSDQSTGEGRAFCTSTVRPRMGKRHSYAMSSS